MTQVRFGKRWTKRGERGDLGCLGALLKVGMAFDLLVVGVIVVIVLVIFSVKAPDRYAVLATSDAAKQAYERVVRGEDNPPLEDFVYFCWLRGKIRTPKELAQLTGSDAERSDLRTFCDWLNDFKENNDIVSMPAGGYLEWANYKAAFGKEFEAYCERRPQLPDSRSPYYSEIELSVDKSTFPLPHDIYVKNIGKRPWEHVRLTFSGTQGNDSQVDETPCKKLEVGEAKLVAKWRYDFDKTAMMTIGVISNGEKTLTQKEFRVVRGKGKPMMDLP